MHIESGWTFFCGETEHRAGVKLHHRQSKYGRILNNIKWHISLAVLAYLLGFVKFWFGMHFGKVKFISLFPMKNFKYSLQFSSFGDLMRVIGCLYHCEKSCLIQNTTVWNSIWTAIVHRFSLKFVMGRLIDKHWVTERVFCVLTMKIK